MISGGTALMHMPELILIVFAAIVMVGGAFLQHRTMWAVVASVGLVAAACALVQWQGPPFRLMAAANGMQVDSLGHTLCWLAVVIGLILVMTAARPAARGQTGEVLGLVLLVVAGLMFASIANELPLVLLGLELISIPTYALLFLGRRDWMSGEAAIKYFFLSLLSSALFLLGLSLVYGMTGSMRFDELNGVFASGAVPSRMILLAVCLIFAGLGFKVAAAPFHFYAPDVYMATTNFNAGLLAVVPKVAGIAVMIRFARVFAPACPEFVWQLMIVLSLLTMTIGNFCALWQTNVRRLMAYSSIAHAGYMLIGIAVAVASVQMGKPIYDGFAGTLLYLAFYSFASLGTFAVLTELSTDEREASTLDQLSGMGQKHPWLAGALAIFIFSLAGIPPLAGFWGKFTLFGGALSLARNSMDPEGGRWFLVLVIVGLLNAAVGAAYYLRLIGTVYFGDRSPVLQARSGGSATVAALACAVLVLVLGVVPGSFVGHFQRVGESLRPSVNTSAPAIPSVAAKIAPEDGFLLAK